jgi:hypothetical protein
MIPYATTFVWVKPHVDSCAHAGHANDTRRGKPMLVVSCLIAGPCLFHFCPIIGEPPLCTAEGIWQCRANAESEDRVRDPYVIFFKLTML